MTPGRSCPVDYRYPASALDRPADFSAEVLYVAGGLYGNLPALDALEALAAAEQAPVTIVLNGDFHWFDAEPAWFAEIERRVAPYRRLRGNVETEIARPEDIGAGCGCAYPDSVDEDVVRRSNQILAELRAAAGRAAPLARLPMHLVAQVGNLRIGIVHGDATSLAGWGFAQDALDDPAAPAQLREVQRASRIDVFASTHTCLAALRDYGSIAVINNGAAGMANFSGSHFGVVTRIATRPAGGETLYGLTRDGVHIDAMALRYDLEAFLDRFLRRWPENSAAHASYFSRIVSGPAHTIACASRTGALAPVS